MSDQFKNKIRRLELENFTCFGKVTMDFSPGINVFIGENGTGKTHLLKVLYSMIVRKDHSMFMSDIARKLRNTFKTPLLDNLVRKIKGKNLNQSTIEVYLGNKKYGNPISWHFEIDKNGSAYPNKVEEIRQAPLELEALFIPSNEIISVHKGFIGTYQKRELAFDETYFDLALALESTPLINSAAKEANRLIADIKEDTGVEVKKMDDKFFISLTKENNELEAQFVAQGINKIAQLVRLIENGSLTKDTILFWDEPEANLNPKYILIVAKFLQTLANTGCQIFVATHDYLLPYELSLSKEYANEVEGKVPDMKFFSLYKGENGTEVEEGETMPDLRHDSIMEGAGRHNDREDILFRKSLNREK